VLGYVEKLEVTNARGNVLSLQLEEDDGPYQVADIDGLDPGKATLVSTTSAGEEGATYQSGKRPPRNIKLKLELDPDFDPKSYEDLRDDLYTWFMPKAQISMRYFMTSGLSVDIAGVVESMDSPLFTDDPDVNVSIMCFKPDFIDNRLVSIEGFSVDDTTNMEIDYPGSVEAGTVVTINFNRSVSDFTIYNTDEGGQLQKLDFSGSLINGDKLVISSLRGNKGITLTRAMASSSYLYGRSSQSSWISLEQGTNQFRVYAEGDPIPYTVEYIVRYGGL
jgi:hypothetical protein